MVREERDPAKLQKCQILKIPYFQKYRNLAPNNEGLSSTEDIQIIVISDHSQFSPTNYRENFPKRADTWKETYKK